MSSDQALPGRVTSAAVSPTEAPRLTTGRYVVPLPRRSSTYVRLARSGPGTTLHLGVQMIGRGGSIGEGFRVDVGTRPGHGNCGSAVAFRPTLHESAPVLYAATTTWSSVHDQACSTSRTLFARIRPATDAADAGRPLQLRVYEEPSLDDSGFSMLTTPSPPVWSGLTPVAAKPVVPGHTADAAPVVQPGTWTVRLEPGDDDFLAVPVDWGGSVRVQLDAHLPAALDPDDPDLDLHVLGPMLDVADTGALNGDDLGRGAGDFRAGVMTEPISYVNRDSVDPGVNGAVLAGMHYIALDYAPAVAAGPLTVRLTVQVGEGDGTAPLYDDVPGLHPPRAGSRIVDGSLSHDPTPTGVAATGSSTITAHGDLPWTTIGLIVVGFVLVGLLLRWTGAARRRRRERGYHARHRS